MFNIQHGDGRTIFQCFELSRKCFAFIRETLPLLAKPLQKNRPKTLCKTMGSLAEVLYVYAQNCCLGNLSVPLSKPHKTFMFTCKIFSFHFANAIFFLGTLNTKYLPTNLYVFYGVANSFYMTSLVRFCTICV